MHEIAFDLLILLVGIWVVAVTLRPLGLPTIMGELIVGVLVGPAVLGLIEPGQALQLLAEIGIFFLMFHAGVETQPLEFLDALKRSLGVAIVGALVPFCVSFAIAMGFGLDWVAATFVALTMTATAVVITLKSLKDLKLDNTRLARVIVASCVIDDLLTLIFFGLVIGVLSGGSFEPLNIVITIGKVIAFFGVAALLGRFVYPRLALPFRSKGGKGFTFVLLTAIAWGLFAEAIGLHMILGAYLAGLFFEEKVAHPNLVRIVNDRAYGIAYSFLGPIFFISLGFSITFDISGSEIGLIVALTLAVIVGQIASAGGMALRMGLPAREALTVGVGMCGRAEMAFILASLALAQGAIGQSTFTALILTAFILNLFTPLALKGCAVLLKGSAARVADATSGIVWVEPFSDELVDRDLHDGVNRSLPEMSGKVAVFGHGPEVESLLEELTLRGVPAVLIEPDETKAARLQRRGRQVVCANIAERDLDLQPLVDARAIVANSSDELDAMLAMNLRELGFSGPIVALVANPNRRAPLQLAGATAAFTPNHVLAAAVAVRASSLISPRVTGVESLGHRLEAAEIRIHDHSPLANVPLAQSGLTSKAGVHVVGQWSNDTLDSPPLADEPLTPGTILIAVGSPEAIADLSGLVRPITPEGTIVVMGLKDVGSKLVEMLKDAQENICVINDEPKPDVDIVGDLMDIETLAGANVAGARLVVLALENDNAALLATAIVRDYAPDVPVIVCASQADNVEKISQAGADFVLSVSQVSGQILAHHILGEMVSHQAHIKLSKLRVGQFDGPQQRVSDIVGDTGCTVIGVERGQDIIMDVTTSFALQQNDGLYVCGTPGAFNRLHERYAPTAG